MSVPKALSAKNVVRSRQMLLLTVLHAYVVDAAGVVAAGVVADTKVNDPAVLTQLAPLG